MVKRTYKLPTGGTLRVFAGEIFFPDAFVVIDDDGRPVLEVRGSAFVDGVAWNPVVLETLVTILKDHVDFLKEMNNATE